MKNWFVRVGLVFALVAAFGLAVAPAIAGGLFGWVPGPSDGGIDWGKILGSILTAVIVTVVPILTVKIIALIKSGCEWLEARKNDSWYLWAADVVADAVFATSQTLGDELKEAAKDGKFTEEEKSLLFNHARDLAFKNFGVIPGKILPVIESWVKAKIESELAKLKILRQIGPASLPLAGVQTAAPSKVG